jgi:hypothetical protein
MATPEANSGIVTNPSPEVIAQVHGQVGAVSVPDDVDTATGLVDWINDAEGDERQARARAAQAVNDARDKPWATVAQAVDSALS